MVADIKKNKNYAYWPAWIDWNTEEVYIGVDAFKSRYDAVAWLKMGNSDQYNLFAKDSNNAKEAAKTAGVKHAVEHNAHKDKPGYFKHWHPAKVLTTDPWVELYKNHVWFPF